VLLRKRKWIEFFRLKSPCVLCCDTRTPDKSIIARWREEYRNGERGSLARRRKRDLVRRNDGFASRIADERQRTQRKRDLAGKRGAL
jgi:hypothetical protein